MKDYLLMQKPQVSARPHEQECPWWPCPQSGLVAGTVARAHHFRAWEAEGELL